LTKRSKGFCSGGLQTAIGDAPQIDGALKCAATKTKPGSARVLSQLTQQIQMLEEMGKTARMEIPTS
jgi:hypothetical protein